jgi:hypothetical protein
MKILVHPADVLGCGFYRMIMPSYVLKSAGHEVDIMHTTLDDVSSYDIIVFQRIHRPGFIPVLEQYRKQAPKAFFCMDIDDDLYNLPHIFRPDDMARFTAFANLLDRMIVSTEYLKNRMIAEGITCPIHVRRNMISLEFWTEQCDIHPKLPNGKRHILMSGAMGHLRNGDLSSTMHLPKKLAKGHQITVLGDELKPVWRKHKNVRFIGWVKLNEFPTVVRILNADFWLAPLNPKLEFNNSKSNIKYLEATAAGAILCAQTTSLPYRDLPGVIYYSTEEELARRINRITDEEMAALYTQAAVHVSENYLLEMQYGVDELEKAWGIK